MTKKPCVVFGLSVHLFFTHWSFHPLIFPCIYLSYMYLLVNIDIIYIRECLPLFDIMCDGWKLNVMCDHFRTLIYIKPSNPKMNLVLYRRVTHWSFHSLTSICTSLGFFIDLSVYPWLSSSFCLSIFCAWFFICLSFNLSIKFLWSELLEILGRTPQWRGVCTKRHWIGSSTPIKRNRE